MWTAKTEPRSESVKAYLFTIARNLFLHNQRKYNRFSSIENDIVDETNQADPLPDSINYNPETQDEMKALRRTRLLLKWRSYLMGFAIFCSLVPFSFFYTDGTIYWLFRQAPTSGIVYGILGIIFWIAYFIIKSKSSDL